MSQKGHNTKTELAKQYEALTEESLLAAFSGHCGICKGDNQFNCTQKCGATLMMACGGISEVSQYVKDFRLILWQPPKDQNGTTQDHNRTTHTLSVRDRRNVLLISELFSMQSSIGEFSFTVGINKVDRSILLLDIIIAALTFNFRRRYLFARIFTENAQDLILRQSTHL